MEKKPVLVVLAAGMGSRYGGLKQIDPVGSQGEAILDYSIYDAHRAGFDTVVIVIKKAIEKDFMETVGKRLEKAPVEIRYAFQELEDLPEGFSVPEDRTKPWGTSHAVLCAAKAIDGAPFAVINADDFYGASAYRVVYDYLTSCQDPNAHCVVGYELGKTVTDHGSVSRGICEADEQGLLTRINERKVIEKYEKGIHFTEDGGKSWTDVPADTLVSMNLWGYMPGFLEDLEVRFADFLRTSLDNNPLKCEFFLPIPVAGMIAEKKATFRVLSSPDQWFGVTYAADKPLVVASLKTLTEQGEYPDGLWK